MPFTVLLKNITETHQSKSIKHLKQMREKNIVILSIKSLSQGLKKIESISFKVKSKFSYILTSKNNGLVV